MSTHYEIISPSTRWQAFVGALPFLAYGIAIVIGEVDHIYNVIGHNAELVVYFITLVGLLIGWIRGFPVWSHGYLGWSLLIPLLGTDSSIYGVTWGYGIWVPLAIIIVIAIVWTRSLNPIGRLVRGIWNDWTRLSLVMYVLLAWGMLIYDGNHHPYLLLFISAAALTLSAGAWLFLRSDTVPKRMVSLLSGFFGAAIIGVICWNTWSYRAYYGLPEPDGAWYQTDGVSIIGLLLWALVIICPAIIHLFRRIATHRRTS